MADRKPLVLDDNAQKQQLQDSDDLDIPLNDQVKSLQKDFGKLCYYLIHQGIELPAELRRKA